MDKFLPLMLAMQEKLDACAIEIRYLRERLGKYEHPKNSNNSSIPPSKDENRPKKNQSLRKKSNNKTGGQPGHKGHTLKFVENPDTTLDYYPETCSSCGESMHVFESFNVVKRQVVDLPIILPVCTEHRAHSVKCTCGHVNKANFPINVNGPIQYGINIDNLVAYLSVGQYMPYNRIASMFKNLFNVPLSQGSIKNILDRFTDKSLPDYQKIRTLIETAYQVGADETGAKMNGDKWWFWAWQNIYATYITASDNRAFRTIENHFPEGFKNATLGSDRYGAQLKTLAKEHQLCSSHLSRDYEYLIELTNSSIIKRLQLLLFDALTLKKRFNDEDYESSNTERAFIRTRTFDLLDSNIDDEHKNVKALIKKLRKSRESIYTFLYQQNVPPDNNGSERAIRNVKVKQKVSTMFKSVQGINSYAIIRSIYDTCIKQGINIFDSHLLKLDSIPE